jgi:hypothetical protein
MFSDHNLNQAPELQIDIEDDGKRRDPERVQNVIFSRNCRLISGTWHVEIRDHHNRLRSTVKFKARGRTLHQ